MEAFLAFKKNEYLVVLKFDLKSNGTKRSISDYKFLANFFLPFINSNFSLKNEQILGSLRCSFLLICLQRSKLPQVKGNDHEN